ncbi:MAG: amidohydrolase family protein [Deltaproteobacteria bacterium]|uniref:Amidohydrolase family protein n=1 Tax=Candidatus Desulfacyla euxinica TaxID=2841693 RepID=A0A8J6N2E0_9DELT|nr:amidohydrolase family protein [Candidatus Desulfacyla euxinica]
MENVRRLTRRDFLKDAAKTAAVVAVSGVLPPIIGCGENGSDVTYDTLIRGGEIHDGMGNAPRIADIGIIGDRIVAIGNLTGAGVRIIEAQGLLVCPGFIDVHTHVDLTYLLLEPIDVFPKDLTGSFNYLYQGVTTVVGGNCGAGYPDIKVFFDKLDKLGGYGTNICTLAPHSLIRQVLFDPQPEQPLSDAQLLFMKGWFETQMEQGTIGFSTGLEYDPGSYSDTTELIELAKVVRKYDGLYTSHTRDQTGTGVPPTDWGVLTSIDEAIKIGIEADIPVHVSHLQVNTPWNDVTASQILEKIENARQGPHAIDVTGCIHTYNIGWGPLNYRLPQKYKKVNGIKDIYKSGEKRLEVQAAIQKVFDEYIPAEKIQICSWEDERYNMQYISDLVKQPEFPENKGKTPAECFVDIVAKDPDVPAPYAYSDEIHGDVKDGIIPGDHIFMSSDGLASSEDRETPIVHPRSFDNATRVLTEFVLPAEGARMDLPSAIRKMTSLPADKFKLRERGRIEEGYFADIVVINRGKLKSNATFEIENRYSEGVEYSLVNGVLAIDNGKATDQRAGKILRRV